jgi:HrpA-like RNA helicase
VKAGCRKIILSTNIADTSVTIQDVVVVIDCGREREVRRNKRTSTSILVTDWCSKANAKQRAGRAGRVQPGLCLKLFSSGTAESLKKTSEPELKRVPLEEVCLSILASGLGKDCYDFLLQAPQPPSDDSILAALDVLEEVGAITSDRKFLTPLGQHLAKLPVDVRLGKMLVLGSLFQCLDKVLTIAASLSSKSPFSTFLQNAEIANAKHRQFKDPDSDFATLCNVWEGYSDARSKSNKAGRSYCQSNFLNPASMHEIASARRDFFNLLSGIGFVGKGGSSPTVFGSDAWKKSDINHHSNNSTLVHAVVFAGLNPNVARLEESRPGSYTLWNKDQQIHFHRTSVNASKKRFSRDQNWVVFFEKFGTPSRTSVSTTCFVGSMPLLLFGGPLVVKHTDRIVIVNDWMEIEMAAQIGVMLKELRVQVENLLLRLIVRNDEVNNKNEKHTNSSSEGKAVITSIVDILSHTTSTR